MWQRLMPVRPVPVWCPDSETFSHRVSRWSLTATLCPVLQMTAGSERARGLRAVIQGMAGLPPGLRAPCRPVTSVPICLVWTHPLLAPGSPPALALHLPRGPLTSLAPLPQCTPTTIRRPVAQVLTPSLGWSPPCEGQTEDSGQAVCAASFLGHPPESPGQVRGRGPRYSACRTAGKGVSGGQPSALLVPVPVSARNVSCPGHPGVGGALSPHVPPCWSDGIFAGVCCAAASPSASLPRSRVCLSVCPSAAQAVLSGGSVQSAFCRVGRGTPRVLSSTLVLGGGRGGVSPSCPLTLQTLGSRLTICRGLNRGPQNPCGRPNPQSPMNITVFRNRIFASVIK